jgi:hypothetical protein
MKNNIELMRDFFVSSKDSLKAQAVKAGSIGHKGSTGAAREQYLVDFLQAFLPISYQATRSRIVDSKGNASSEFDIVISNLLWSPTILKKDGACPIFVENVVAAIEVKSFVDKKAIDDTDKKIKTISTLTRKLKSTFIFDQHCLVNRLTNLFTRSLRIKTTESELIESRLQGPVEINALSSGDNYCRISPIHTILFGYDGIKEHSMISHLNKMEFKADIVIVIDKGVFLKEDNVYVSPPGIIKSNMELGQLAFVISDWIDRSNTDRLLFKSKLEYYL